MMLANGKTMKWEGGSFHPNGPRIGRGEGGGRLAKNFTRWSSKEPVMAARIFVGFNVGEDPVYKLDDLIEIVKKARWAQIGDPSSTFIAQRGIYRHGDDVVEEEGAQIILINTEGFSYEGWVEQMVLLAEAIAERMQQDEVFVEIQESGVTKQVLGVAPGRMAANAARPVLEYMPNADWEATGRIAYRGRGSEGPGVEASLETRADQREGPSIDYKLVPNQLRSASSLPGTQPLTEQEEEAAYEAGYEMVSDYHARGRLVAPGYFDLDDIFVDVLQKDRRVPNVTEDDPQFWEWRFWVHAGAGDYGESQMTFEERYPSGKVGGRAKRRAAERETRRHQRS